MTRVIDEKILANLQAMRDAGHITQEQFDELKAKDIAQDTETLELKAKVAALETTAADLTSDLQAIATVFSDPEVAQPETNAAIAEVLTASDAVPGTVEPAFPS